MVAINDALEKAQGLQQELMGSVTGGMKDSRPLLRQQPDITRTNAL